MTKQNKRNPNPKRGGKRRPAGWDAVAEWYDGWMGRGGSIHHRKLAVPTVINLLDPQKGEQILDIGAGQGVLAPDVSKAGADYTGIDVSARLLEYARQHHGQYGRFLEGDAARLHEVSFIHADQFDGVVFLLSIQDMDPLYEVLKAATWALKPDGRMVILMTHPCFRIPRQSGWGFDEGRKLQYRRIDRYLTPLPVPMKQHSTGVTISFHRPLQDYINGLSQFNVLTERIDEIPGKDPLNKKQTKAEKNADAEIPLFLALRGRKIG